MPVKIVYLPKAYHIKKAVHETMQNLSVKFMPADGETAVEALQILPLVEAVDHLTDLATGIEAMILHFEMRISAFEAALASGAAKPTSDFATQLDQRLTASQDLLRAMLERLDQVEAAVIRLYKTPFLPIDEHDLPRKELALLRAKFDVACPGAPGSSG